MQQSYVATLQIELYAESVEDACDTVSALFTERLQQDGSITEWCYLKIGHHYPAPSIGSLPTEPE